MGDDVRDELGQWLGADTRALDALGDHDLEELRAALVTARKNQARALAAASEEALRQMPPLLRVSVSKILGR